MASRTRNEGGDAPKGRSHYASYTTLFGTSAQYRFIVTWAPERSTYCASSFCGHCPRGLLLQR